LFANSIVTHGFAKAIVCQVG
jgi:magnesium-transporting ATPase (P-type)